MFISTRKIQNEVDVEMNQIVIQLDNGKFVGTLLEKSPTVASKKASIAPSPTPPSPPAVKDSCRR